VPSGAAVDDTVARWKRAPAEYLQSQSEETPAMNTALTRNSAYALNRPDALRAAEIHDFSDLSFGYHSGRRALYVVLTIAALLTVSHFANEMIEPAHAAGEVSQTQTLPSGYSMAPTGAAR
jgi:hypothetical protein